METGRPLERHVGGTDTNITTKMYFEDVAAYVKFTFHYSKSHPDKNSTASLRLGSCASLGCYLGVPYDENGLNSTSPKPDFWRNWMHIEIPPLEQCRRKELHHLALSLSGVPKLDWHKTIMDQLQANTDTEAVWDLLKGGKGAVEILLTYGQHHQLTKPKPPEIARFVDHCQTLGALRTKEPDCALRKHVVDTIVRVMSKPSATRGGQAGVSDGRDGEGGEVDATVSFLIKRLKDMTESSEKPGWNDTDLDVVMDELKVLTRELETRRAATVESVPEFLA